MFKYAGVPLLIPNNSQIQYWDKELNFTREQLFFMPYANIEGLISKGLPVPRFRESDDQVHYQTLVWPTGASRFAYLIGFINEDRLNEIRKKTVKNPVVHEDLEITDGELELTTKMFMLPARPLRQLGFDKNLYLIILVDKRFYWWYKSDEITINEGTTTWATLISSVATSLGETITTDTISSKFVKPSADWDISYEPLPPYLDAILFSIGHRLVRDFDGTIKTESLDTSLPVLQSNRSNSLSTYRAGGFLELVR